MALEKIKASNGAVKVGGVVLAIVLAATAAAASYASAVARIEQNAARIAELRTCTEDLRLGQHRIELLLARIATKMEIDPTLTP